MFKNFDIAVDTTKGVRNQAISVNTNDLQSLQFSFTITQSGVPVNLTGATVRLAVKKPDKKTVFQDCTITDAVNGKCEIILDTQAYIVPGLHPVELMIYYAVDKVSVTGRFSYTANKGILDDGSVVSTNEFQAINQALTDVENIVVDLRDNGTGVDAQARTDLQTVTTQLAETTLDVEYLKENTSGTPSIIQESFSGVGDIDKNLKYYGDYLSIINQGAADITATPYNYDTGETLPSILIPIGLGYGGFLKEFSRLTIDTTSSYYIEVRGKGLVVTQEVPFIKNGVTKSASTSIGYKGSAFTVTKPVTLEGVQIIGIAASWELWEADDTNTLTNKIAQGTFTGVANTEGYSNYKLNPVITLVVGKKYVLFANYSLEGQGKFISSASSLNTSEYVTPLLLSRNQTPAAGSALAPNYAYDYKVIVKEVV